MRHETDTARGTIVPPAGGGIDETALTREAWIRLGREMRQVAAALAQAARGSPGEAAARALERLDALVELQWTLGGGATRVRLDDRVIGVCDALARCAASRRPPTMEVSVPVAAVDRTTALAVGLVVVALLAGEIAGGPVRTDGRVEIEVDLTPVCAEVAVRDLGDDPPDRREVGGGLLRRLLAATNATCSREETPGLATVRVAIPVADMLTRGAEGHA